MTRKSLRFLITYLVLVGGPLAGLVALVDYGGAIVAPPAIGGAWALRATAPGLACFGLDPEPVLSVAQSGRHLGIGAGPLHGAGTVDGQGLRAELPTPAGPCERLALTLELTPDGRASSGRVEAPGCSACASVAVAARRLASAATKAPTH